MLYTDITEPHLRVSAGNRLLALLDTSSDTNAVLVATRVGHSSRDPDAVGATNAVGAGDEVAAIELQVVALVDGPAGALSIAGTGLAASGISELTLACIPLAFDIHLGKGIRGRTHAGAVDIGLLGAARGAVEEQSFILDVEGGETIIGALAGSVLATKTSEKAALGRVEAGVLNTRARVDGDEAKGLGGGSRLRGGSEGHRGSDGERGELHSD